MKYRHGLVFPRTERDAWGHPGHVIEAYRRPFDPERAIVRPIVFLAIAVVAALAFAGVL